jgi:DNA invertase Pin-like site-specific DNA recombinase
MGRLTLNVLLSFAQFERELIGERVRDKIAASKLRAIIGDAQLGQHGRSRSNGWNYDDVNTLIPGRRRR